ncbi:hypothetical protein AGR3A_Cc370029 [Agrobacterium tomkonis CFBP 6623]|uniref:Uncharacterized protein n=1 Tax=Agrobacterium tomkonis CFBP 6623 TaxID=1183432 RepID=A0A1S7PZP7_9HYPH|nr:hypothetical protein AGR3A_Cc370029 [Agrobacterium tomkonis CFBP 6623]
MSLVLFTDPGLFLNVPKARGLRRGLPRRKHTLSIACTRDRNLTRHWITSFRYVEHN